MSSYSTALASYLATPERTQAALAAAVNTAQPNIHRWANGSRFPDAAMARAIDLGMRPHSQRMDPRVGAPGGMDQRILAGDAVQRILDRSSKSMRRP